MSVELVRNKIADGKSFIVVVDAGHGTGKAYNRGALMGNEGDNNFYFALELKKELEKYENVVVKLTRNKISDNPSFATRGKLTVGADLFLSVHSNATDNPNVRGFEIWEDVNTDDGGLAQKLCDALDNEFGGTRRGVKHKKTSSGTDWYAVLRLSKALSSMLIEHGFHTNILDAKKYVEERTKIARIEAQTIAEFYGLKLKDCLLESTNVGKVEAVQSTTISPSPKPIAKPKPVAQKPKWTEYAESGRFYPVYRMNIRTSPSLKGTVKYLMAKGSVVPSKAQKYDKVVINDKHVWISWWSTQYNTRLYCAVRPENKPRGFWGYCR